MVTALYFKTKVRSQKYKKSRCAIGNVSEKELSKIIKEFEKIGKVPYVKRIPKHEPTSRYFHLVRQLAKCMTRYDEHNRHVHGSYAEETAPESNVNVTYKDESKEIIVHETLSQNNSTDVPDNVITELKDNEHKEPSVTGKVTSYFNIFECGRNLLNQLDVTYKQALMTSPVQ